MPNNTSVLNIYGNYKDMDINYFTSQDYFVHMLRFSKIAEQVENKNILDLGCGHYTNLLKAICLQTRGPHYKSYIGTDYNNIIKWRPDYTPIWSKSTLIPQTDFTNADHVNKVIDECLKRFNGEDYIVTCFEVLEHMDFEMQNKFLYQLSRLVKTLPGKATIYFSTPNHNGNPAKNHISELSYKLLEEMFERYDFNIEEAQGLSAWRKFCKAENLPNANVFDFNISELPSGLQKMVWGAMLPRQFSNNILYTLSVTPCDINTYDKQRKANIKYKYEEYRQGGAKQSECINLFSIKGDINE